MALWPALSPPLLRELDPTLARACKVADCEPKTGSLSPLRSKLSGRDGVLPEILNVDIAKSWSLEALSEVLGASGRISEGLLASPSKDCLLHSSVHTTSYASLASNTSEPPEALFAKMPTLPQHLRLESLLQKSDSSSSFRHCGSSRWGVPGGKVRKDSSKARKDKSHATLCGNHGRVWRINRGDRVKKQQTIAEGAVRLFLKQRADHSVPAANDDGKDMDDDLESGSPQSSDMIAQHATTWTCDGAHTRPSRQRSSHTPSVSFSGTHQRASQTSLGSKSESRQVAGDDRNDAIGTTSPRRSRFTHTQESRNTLAVNEHKQSVDRRRSNEVNHQSSGHAVLEHNKSAELQQHVIDKRFTVTQMTANRSRKSRGVKGLPFQERMKVLDEKRGEQMKQTKHRQRQELKVQAFSLMSVQDRDALEAAFTQYDIDRSGFLDLKELVACLREFGLAGMNAEEKREIFKICCEAMASDDEVTAEKCRSRTELHRDEVDLQISLLDFALVVVPHVRTSLAGLRADELLRVFLKYDTDGSGTLSKDEMKELARHMGLDIRELTKEVQDKEVDFETFKEIIIRGREQQARACRVREREVQTIACLSDDDFQAFSLDLVTLYDLFARYEQGQLKRSESKRARSWTAEVSTDSKFVKRAELAFLLQECGLAPANHDEKEDFEMLLEQARFPVLEFDFGEFLQAVRHVRRYRQKNRREELVARFVRYDRAKTGYLPHSEISLLLSDLGLVPQNRKEQEALAYIISAVDLDGSGYINFPELMDLSQRIREKLNIFFYEEQIEQAMRLGFTETQMRDLRWVFDSLDEDGGGTLDAAEVRSGLLLMGKELSQKSFDALFKNVDTDGTGFLDYMEFLHFMKEMRESEMSPNGEDRQQLATKAQHLEMRVLRRSLEYFRISKHYIETLDQQELVNLFCEFFKVTPMANLQLALKVKTVGDLYEAAQRRDQVMQTSGIW